MSRFLQSLFGRKPAPTPVPATDATDPQPDNTRLLQLLAAWAADESVATYRQVVEELAHGNALLLLPSLNDDGDAGSWRTLTEGSTLKLTGVFDVDGLKTLAAFTDEPALRAWAGQPSQYTALRAADALAFCQDHGIGRIVINSNAPTMFVLERSRESIRTEVIREQTEVQVGPPQRPLTPDLVARLVDSCRAVSTIAEVYQYAMLRGGELSLVLGFRLDTYSEDARRAALGAVQRAFEEVQPDQPLDVFMLETTEWLTTVQGIDNALLYRR
ncbi:hypothetical protein GCM10027048_11030 [Hymenobacter coalescens]